MNTRAAYALIALLGVYYVLHYAQHQGVGPAWIRHYGKDLLFIPTLLLATWWAMRMAGKPTHISSWHIAGAVVYVSVIFECMLPRFSPLYTSDWIDVAAYTAGGILFWASMAALHLRKRGNSSNQ